jgi:hypothetical protein
MSKKQTTLWASATDTAWKRILVTVVILLAIVLIPWGVAEFSYQQRVAGLNRDIDSVEQSIVTPAGGVKLNSYIKAPHVLNSFCIDNGPCPNLTREWYVPVEPGKGVEFVNSILNKEGYNITFQNNLETTTIANGVKNKHYINLKLAPLGNEQPPHAALQGKDWKLLSVTMSD